MHKISKKKLIIWKTISIFVIFSLSSIIHNLYEWFPCFLTSILAPINESIWEHNKIIISSFLIWSVFEKCTIRKKHDLNTCTSGLISALTCSFLVCLYLAQYTFIF